MRWTIVSAVTGKFFLVAAVIGLFDCQPYLCGQDLQRMEWNVEGTTRQALLYIPETARTVPCPLVFAFHGHGGSERNAASSFGYHRLWPEAISVYMRGLRTPGILTDPAGRKTGWQHTIGDQDDRDLKFFDAVLATLTKDYKVDEKRIYATGHSNGGAFTYLLWAARGDVFAAVAPDAAAAPIGESPDHLPAFVAQRLAEARESLKDLKPKPLMHVAGKRDTLVRLDWQERTIDAVRKLNGCGEGEPWGEDCTQYPSNTDTPVVTYIHAGGHQSPPNTPALIVKFFKEHAKP